MICGDINNSPVRVFRPLVQSLLVGLATALLLVTSAANATPDQDLLAAIDAGELSKAEKALKKKANPEARGTKGATALMLAAERGHVDIARLLLSSGANVATTRDGGIVAIHHAAGGGRVEALKLLLASGANVSARTDSGLTPLIAAGRAGNLEVIKALLDAGAAPTEKDNSGMTAFMTAAQSQCVECLQLLRIPGDDIYATTDKGWSILDYGVVSRSAAVMTYLFEQGATFEAAKTAKDQVLFSFIAEHADVLLKKPTASIETFQMLIARGANIEAKTVPKGLTPLLHAAQMGDTAAVQALIEAKADINARDKEQATALMLAVSRNVLETAKMFMTIREGAPMKQLFMPPEKSDKSPATANRLAVTRLLIQGGVAVNAVDQDGDTVLNKAARLGDVELVSLLLTSGAEVNAINKTGRTPLMSAASLNFPECVTVLLAAGANSQIAAPDGKTALDIAKAGKHKEVVKLLEAG